MNKEIEIPEGYEARIESNKVVLIPKESGDGEKIRKELISHFGYLQKAAIKKEVPEKWYGISYDDIIAWLERQKEQKSLSISAASEWLRKHVRLYMNSEYNEFHKCVEYDGNIDEERLINDFEEAMQKEQQPAEKQGIVARLKEHFANTPKEQLEAEWKKLEKWNHVGPTVEEYLHSIKPAEWSEDIIRKAVKEVGLTQHQIDWFKTNVFPPKQEWSEEDERNLQLLSAMCDDIKGDSATYSTMYREMEELKTWLKSLKNRGNSLKSNTNSPSWEPSKPVVHENDFDCVEGTAADLDYWP